MRSRKCEADEASRRTRSLKKAIAKKTMDGLLGDRYVLSDFCE